MSDIAFGDLDADDEPELLVAWQGDNGIHSVGMDGKQRWINRVASDIASIGLTLAHGSKSVFVTSELGPLYLIDPDGRTEREVSLGQAAIHHATVWPGHARGYEPMITGDTTSLPNSSASYCGVSMVSSGATVLLGISRDWKGLWEYALPRGVYRHQVDWPQSLHLPSIGPTWLIPGPDGSVHFVSADGRLPTHSSLARTFEASPV